MMKKSLLLLFDLRAASLAGRLWRGRAMKALPPLRLPTPPEASAPDATEPVNLKTLLETVQQTCTLDSGSIYSSYSDTLGEYMDEEMILGKYGAQSPAPDFSVYAQYALYFSFETYQDEVALFEVRDASDIEPTKRFLHSESTNCWRAPSIIPSWILTRFENAVIESSGNYVYCIACRDRSRRYAPLLRKRSAEI